MTFTVEETGRELVLDASGHATLMQVAVEADVPGIVGECGGEMTCGTCHVHVESTPAGYTAARSHDEEDMLEVVDAPAPGSRLACQLPVTPAVAGLRLRVPAPS
ncbi:2Fe-2S iron-sulfur cluster-binding protein [Goekera deserti]|uniref:2Fe-2S iron-sulfur cluster binding domain-containing protein n=1 Tax=Goekera deserti TaxID=2497753 RepID=A0A7K3WFZ4_9ACTN|nr:2Fe-2S iron-sulfur cluster-binding protein [Goekera deserti]NDI47192.1 2Fe-2S iron-sulfur cluster binding domain-containing protein [Goekera deserti]NEL55408.1 2Fe-2S iron-sulfur cluster binding domain-containing protein [Goekera deserti]